MKTSIDTILFDLDGTLINTNELIIASYLHTLNTFYPQQFTRKHIVPLMGMRLDETFLKLVENGPLDKLTETYREHNLAHHEEYVYAFDGVVDTVDALYEQGYKLAIVTTKRRSSVELGLKITGLEPYFTTIVTLDDVQHAKPDPEPVLTALDQLGSSAASAVMVGDSQYDIKAGQNAGVMTAAVAWTIRGKAHLAQFNPDFMVEKMPDLLDIVGVKVS
jgi:pyrophosphatase PpaX